jgi:hypothetical protein
MSHESIIARVIKHLDKHIERFIEDDYFGTRDPFLVSRVLLQNAIKYNDGQFYIFDPDKLRAICITVDEFESFLVEIIKYQASYVNSLHKQSLTINKDLCELLKYKTQRIKLKWRIHRRFCCIYSDEFPHKRDRILLKRVFLPSSDWNMIYKRKWETPYSILHSQLGVCNESLTPTIDLERTLLDYCGQDILKFMISLIHTYVSNDLECFRSRPRMMPTVLLDDSIMWKLMIRTFPHVYRHIPVTVDKLLYILGKKKKNDSDSDSDAIIIEDTCISVITITDDVWREISKRGLTMKPEIPLQQFVRKLVRYISAYTGYYSYYQAAACTCFVMSPFVLKGMIEKGMGQLFKKCAIIPFSHEYFEPIPDHELSPKSFADVFDKYVQNTTEFKHLMPQRVVETTHKFIDNVYKRDSRTYRGPYF